MNEPIRSPAYGIVKDEFGADQICLILTGTELRREEEVVSNADFPKFDKPYVGYQLSLF